MKHLLIIVAFSMASVGVAHGDGIESPFAFGAGARDLATGGSSIASPDPVTAPFWNPGALVQVERPSFGMFYTRLLECDGSYQYIGATYPTLDFGTIGIGLFRLGVDGIDRRDENNLDLGEFSDSHLAFYFAYGYRLLGYDLGLSISLKHEALDVYKSTSSPGLSLGLGRRFETGYDWLRHLNFGLVVRNAIAPGLKLESETVREPQSTEAALSIGMSPRLRWNQRGSIFFSFDKTEGLPSRMASGIEWSFQDIVSLRAGLRDGHRTFGLGIEIGSMRFDYAYLDRDLEGLHTFSLTAEVGLPRSERIEIREKQREAKFNDLLRQRLRQYNREKVDTLVEQGKDLLNRGNYEEASVILDRALFLAAGNEMDTTDVYELAEQAKRMVEVQHRRLAYVAYMDSALTRMDSGDFLGVRYFAELALGEDPQSDDARQLIATATRALEERHYRAEMIEHQILIADSLLTYGNYDEALVAARSVAKVTKGDSRVSLIIKKAAFGRFREIAENAISAGNLHLARSARDSACRYVSGHPWCRSFVTRLSVARSERGGIKPLRRAVEREVVLKGEALKQVEKTYERAKKLFESGNLEEAIARWEEVERMAPGYRSVRDYLVSGYKFLGVELYTNGKLEEAIQVWRKAANLSPDSSEIASFIRRTQAEIARLQELSNDNQ